MNSHSASVHWFGHDTVGVKNEISIFFGISSIFLTEGRG